MKRLRILIAGCLLGVVGVVLPVGWGVAATISWGPVSEIESAARKEASVVIYAAPGHTTRQAEQAISQIFKERYGVNIEWTNLPAADIAPRILAEQRTKQYVADIVMTGFPIFYSSVKPRGYISPILAPSTLEQRIWRLDPAVAVPQDRDWLYVSMPLRPSFFINTDIVRAGEEPKSYKDLLDPRWKGRIALENPASGGTGIGWFLSTYKKLGLDYMRALAKQLVVVPTTANVLIDGVVRGQYAVGLAASPIRGRQLIKEGAPVRFVQPKEGAHLASQGIHFVANAPHPNSAKLFLQWFYTREGQSVYSQNTLTISVRKDVPQEHLSLFERYIEGQPFMMAEWNKEELTPEGVAEITKLAQQIFNEGK